MAYNCGLYRLNIIGDIFFVPTHGWHNWLSTSKPDSNNNTIPYNICLIPKYPADTAATELCVDISKHFSL